MSRKIPIDDLDHATCFLNSGKTLNESAKILGFHPDNLSKRLRSIGINTDRRAGRPANNRLNINVPPIIKSYLAGESELSISKRTGIDRIVIHQRLVESGIHIRTGSEANIIRFQRASEKERKAITRLAKSQWRKDVKKRTPEIMNKIAQTRCKRIGMGELELSNALQKSGLPDLLR